MFHPVKDTAHPTPLRTVPEKAGRTLSTRLVCSGGRTLNKTVSVGQAVTADIRACFKTIKVIIPGYRQHKYWHEKRVLLSLRKVPLLNAAPYRYANRYF